MTSRFIAAFCCMLLVAASAVAQSQGAKPKADPVSGTWTGELRRDGADEPTPVTMELKFDGKSAVSGTVSGLPRPADVKEGTYDSKTGALKLQLGKQGESQVLLVLEGMLAKGEASGKVTGEGSGQFKIAKKK